jgi:hypothetical protein
MMATVEAGVRGLGIIRMTTATALQHLKSGALQQVLMGAGPQLQYIHESVDYIASFIKASPAQA